MRTWLACTPPCAGPDFTARQTGHHHAVPGSRLRLWSWPASSRRRRSARRIVYVVGKVSGQRPSIGPSPWGQGGQGAGSLSRRAAPASVRGHAAAGARQRVARPWPRTAWIRCSGAWRDAGIATWIRMRSRPHLGARLPGGRGDEGDLMLLSGAGRAEPCSTAAARTAPLTGPPMPPAVCRWAIHLPCSTPGSRGLHPPERCARQSRAGRGRASWLQILAGIWPRAQEAKVVASGMVSALPAPKELERRCQALAVLDPVLCSDPLWRYYAFDQRPGGAVRRFS